LEYLNHPTLPKLTWVSVGEEREVEGLIGEGVEIEVVVEVEVEI
jgi:hypothetical protein